MFKISAGADITTDLVTSIYPRVRERGSVFAQRSVGKRLDRVRIPREQVGWFINQLPPTQKISVSTASFNGQGIFLNCVGTRVLAVDVRLRDPSRGTQLAEQLAWRLEREKVPRFSALLVGPAMATLVWVLTDALDDHDVYIPYFLERGLSSTLGELAYPQRPIGVSRMLPLPLGDASATQVVVAGDCVETVDTDRALHAFHEHAVPGDHYSLRRSYEALQELNTLLFHRFFEIANYRERFWVLLAAYTAAITPFVASNELKNCIRALSVSLHNKRWETIKDVRIPGCTFTYQQYLDILTRNAKEGVVLLDRSDHYYNISRSEWSRVAAEQLAINHFEAARLGLRHMLPRNIQTESARYLSNPQRMPIGQDDYVPLNRFLMKAA